MVAKISSASASAAESVLSSTAPTASPKTEGKDSAEAPPSASSACPVRIVCAACATASSPDEHAEFTEIEGPIKSNAYETRVAMSEPVLERGSVKVVVHVSVDAGGGYHGRTAGRAIARRIARAFEGSPGHLKEEPMLRVHDGGLVRRERPKRRVEEFGPVHHVRGRHPTWVREHVGGNSLSR
eukprot:scaffold211702_cov27-Tisochrysis_lutea.AAC.6